MTFKQALYIITVVECGSISRAAQKLYISQPSLSQTIQNMENEIGTKLINRVEKPLSLTYAGEKYLEAAYKLLEIEQNLSREIAEIKQEEAGTIKIGISSLRGVTILPSILSQFTKKYPLVKIEISEQGSASQKLLLEEGRVDIAFVLGKDSTPGAIVFEPLFREHLILFAGPDTDIAKRIPSKTPISIEEAKDETFIYIKEGHGIRKMQDKILSDNNITPKILFEAKSVDLAKSISYSCNCVSFYPEVLMACEGYLPKANEIYYPIADEKYAWDFCLCYNKDAYQPKFIKEFISLTKEYFTSLKMPLGQ